MVNPMVAFNQHINSSEAFDTPILFLIFNRPSLSNRVFQVIREIKPKKLFIAADGPRPENHKEFQLCSEAREIVNLIDWECELYTKFEDKNRGCRKGVSEAISWFFSNIEEGIILEDDCLPNLSFFYFCQELLKKYRNDYRIMEISGNNFYPAPVSSDGTYYFNRLGGIWGWATWKRAWLHYDPDMMLCPTFVDSGCMGDLFADNKTRNYWTRCLMASYNGGPSWSYAWLFAIFSNYGLCISPKKNLVSNIGFDRQATQAKSASNNFDGIQTKECWEIIHPSFVVASQASDSYFTKLLLQESPNYLYIIFRRMCLVWQKLLNIPLFTKRAHK